MTGKTFEVTKFVSEELLAKAVGSGDVAVFATPMMIAMMEEAAAKCIVPMLEPGQTSVGTMMNTSHVAATPAGMQVRAVATVTGVDGRSVTFRVEAFDEAGLIGEGTHSRVIVNHNRFEEKAQAKLAGRA
ncbi:MAG: thioesterase family protein [Oscillospiraceae bacterium]|jgi:fluoroacetyl-CoA thioesterase